MELRTAEERRGQMVNAGRSAKRKSNFYMFMIITILVAAGLWGYVHSAYNVFPVILGVVFILIWFFNSFGSVPSESNTSSSWLAWPSVDEYLAENPQCKSGTGVVCKKCNSNEIRATLWCNSSETRKIHLCNRCGSRLFVSE